jgi:hypothetical protein
MLQLIGVLIIEVLLTRLFMWLTKTLGRPNSQKSQIFLANALSLTVYTVAMGYSLVPDLTSGEPPHLLTAFYIGVLPQLICLAYGLMATGRNTAAT